jgi:hypothetical protein
VPYTRAVESGRLNRSPESSLRTPPPHQPRLIRVRSSHSRGSCHHAPLLCFKRTPHYRNRLTSFFHYFLIRSQNNVKIVNYSLLRPSQDKSFGPVAHNPTRRSRTLRNKIGRLFSGPASCLDAFSTYPLARSYPAMPCQTTGTPEAPAKCSSRTDFPLPSVLQHTW